MGKGKCITCISLTVKQSNFTESDLLIYILKGKLSTCLKPIPSNITLAKFDPITKYRGKRTLNHKNKIAKCQHYNWEILIRTNQKTCFTNHDKLMKMRYQPFLLALPNLAITHAEELKNWANNQLLVIEFSRIISFKKKKLVNNQLLVIEILKA